MQEKRSLNMLFTEKEAMYTATHYKVYYSNLFDFCSCTQNHMLRHSGSFLNVPRCTLSHLIHSQIYFKDVCMTLKKEKKSKTSVLQWRISQKSGGDLFNGAQYACLSTRSQLIFSSSWLWGSGGLDLNAQLITAMHCTAHICNRTE